MMIKQTEPVNQLAGHNLKLWQILDAPETAVSTKNEMTQLELAKKMAYHDMRSWQAHDAKEPAPLIDEMARLYALQYPISYEDARETLSPWVAAVWWHDIAETAEDAGDQEIADKYWEKVMPYMVEHYTLLLKKMKRAGAEEIGKQVAHHDFERWQVHHRRGIEHFQHHEASMHMLLLGINYDDALIIATLRTEAVWLHNKTHIIENGGTEQEAQMYWQQTQDKLVECYQVMLDATEAAMMTVQGGRLQE